jgi:hypothetical protein
MIRGKEGNSAAAAASLPGKYCIDIVIVSRGSSEVRTGTFGKRWGESEWRGKHKYMKSVAAAHVPVSVSPLDTDRARDWKDWEEEGTLSPLLPPQ